MNKELALDKIEMNIAEKKERHDYLKYKRYSIMYEKDIAEVQSELREYDYIAGYLRALEDVKFLVEDLEV